MDRVVLSVIFSFLEERELAMARGISRVWREVADCEIARRPLLSLMYEMPHYRLSALGSWEVPDREPMILSVGKKGYYYGFNSGDDLYIMHEKDNLFKNILETDYCISNRKDKIILDGRRGSDRVYQFYDKDFQFLSEERSAAPHVEIFENGVVIPLPDNSYAVNYDRFAAKVGDVVEISRVSREKITKIAELQLRVEAIVALTDNYLLYTKKGEEFIYLYQISTGISCKTTIVYNDGILHWYEVISCTDRFLFLNVISVTDTLYRINLKTLAVNEYPAMCVYCGKKFIYFLDGFNLGVLREDYERYFYLKAAVHSVMAVDEENRVLIITHKDKITKYKLLVDI